MRKFVVELFHTVNRYAKVEVTAGDKSEARLLAWDVVKPGDWSEKTGDSDSYVWVKE